MSLINGLKGAMAGVDRARAGRAAHPERYATTTNNSSGLMYCKSCGHRGATKTVTPGSILIELVLWCFLLVPGLIYSLWRHNKRHEVCGLCGSGGLIPGNSPLAQSAKSSAD